MSAKTRDSYLVIGGSGFLGRHIVEALLARGDVVSVFDIVQRYHDVPFYGGDISEEEQVASAIEKSGTTCIIHTASPAAGIQDPALYWKVNVDGTKAVIAAAQKKGVRKLVYTSSAGVVFNGADIIDVDERTPFPEKAMDAYNESKAKAEEAVLEANDEDGLLTVALRPAGIFGPGDRQVMAGLCQVYERNQTHFQIGDNTNLFDWTYVGNVAHAHLLAADKLSETIAGTLDLEKVKEDIATRALPQITKTTGQNRVPTSEARPLGPYLYRPDDADALDAKWNDPNYDPSANRPLRRNKFDQFADPAIAYDDSHLSVAGQVFFITNGEPVYFWDFLRAVWKRLDEANGNTRKEKSRIVFSKPVGMVLASGAEWWGWLSGKEPAFTKFRVTFSCASRWHNIEKARRLLGYEPIVGMDEGLDKMVDWYLKNQTTTKA
ncbi:C-3 sterol dehydrogenase [Cristinia sonorae]|uniref:C-3 sterol dehydrogenase n=1 Tax=Cristinia sonorae TaxID=1940300 RepID=A0A8K0XT23_9AGAR|nr:C-3 sterol dehydrogenase [Cristinia sonorae]